MFTERKSWNIVFPSLDTPVTPTSLSYTSLSIAAYTGLGSAVPKLSNILPTHTKPPTKESVDKPAEEPVEKPAEEHQEEIT